MARSKKLPPPNDSLLREAIQAELDRRNMTIAEVVKWKIRCRNATYGFFSGRTRMTDDGVSSLMDRLELKVVRR